MMEISDPKYEIFQHVFYINKLGHIKTEWVDKYTIDKGKWVYFLSGDDYKSSFSEKDLFETEKEAIDILKERAKNG